MSYTLRVLLNALALAAVLTVNYLSNALPLNGKTAGQLSDEYPNLFVPAGLTFAIWGVIYLFLLGWVLVQVLGLFSPGIRQRTEAAVARSGWWFVLTCVFNIVWLFAWHWQYVALSVGLMAALLWSLVRLNAASGVGVKGAKGLERWLAHPGYGIYQGWITVALIANVTALLVTQGFTGGAQPQIWTIAMAGIGAGIAIWMVLRGNVWHGFAVAWALLGIYLKRNGLGDAPAVALSAAVLAVLVLGAAVWRSVAKG